MVTARWVVPALGLGNTVGLVVSGAALLARGPPGPGPGRAARHGLRAAAAGLAGAVAGAAAGGRGPVRGRAGHRGFFPNARTPLLACCGAVIAFGVAAYALDGGDLRAVVARTKRKVLP